MTLVAVCLVIPQRMRLSGTIMGIWRLKDKGVTTLTFWDHLTSSAMWPFNSRASTSYAWSTMTMHLSGTVLEIWHLKDNGVTTFTFRGHVTDDVTWPFDSRGSTSYGWSFVTTCLSSTVMEIWPFEDLEGRLFQEQRLVVGQSSILHWSHILLFATLGTQCTMSKKWFICPMTPIQLLTRPRIRQLRWPYIKC